METGGASSTAWTSSGVRTCTVSTTLTTSCLIAVEHVGEELERLALVLLLRILLRIAAQVDALPQVVELGEVVAPVLVERLQHQAALELAHELGPDLRLLARVLRERGVDQTVAQRCRR